jgi:hypothetical protein
MSLCSIPVRMSRDGYAGANAHLYLPFYGHYFFSGAQMTFQGSTIEQDKSRFIGGMVKSGPAFTKGYTCECKSC